MQLTQLTKAQEVKLRDLLARNLKTVRAYLLKEDFRGSVIRLAGVGGQLLDGWCNRTMRSRLKPVKKEGYRFWWTAGQERGKLLMGYVENSPD